MAATKGYPTMTYKPRRERRAKGGKAVTEPLHPEHGHQYNAVGSPEAKEENEKPDGFRRGGAMKKHKEGGKVEGEAARHHLGKRARGGAAKEHEKREHEKEMPHRARGGHVEHKRARGGGAPFSEAHRLSPPGNDKKTGPGENTEAIP